MRSISSGILRGKFPTQQRYPLSREKPPSPALGTYGAAVLFLVLAAATFGALLPADAQEAVFIVRHTDPPPVLRIDEIREDTPLSDSGQQRAKMLAATLKDAGISVIYATEALRTVQTAEPLAEALGLKIHVQPVEDVAGLIKRLRSEHPQERVLVVGHWATIPLILNGLGYSRDIKIQRSEFDNLFVVIPGPAATVLRLHY